MRDWSPFLGLPLWVWLFVFPAAFGLICLLMGPRLRRTLSPVWALLDRVYFASGVLAAVCMVSILALIVAQMIARWSGVAFPGSTEFAGYAMAATSFFAMAHALQHGAHIRVSILLNLGHDFGRRLDAFAVFMAAIIATYFARYAIKTNILSEMLNDRTQGQDKVPEWLLALVSLPGAVPSEWGAIWASAGEEWVFTPVWLPQIAMSCGTVLLAVALWDTLYRSLVMGKNPIVSEVLE